MQNSIKNKKLYHFLIIIFVLLFSVLANINTTYAFVTPDNIPNSLGKDNDDFMMKYIRDSKYVLKVQRTEKSSGYVFNYYFCSDKEFSADKSVSGNYILSKGTKVIAFNVTWPGSDYEGHYSLWNDIGNFNDVRIDDKIESVTFDLKDSNGNIVFRKPPVEAVVEGLPEALIPLLMMIVGSMIFLVGLVVSLRALGKHFKAYSRA